MTTYTSLSILCIYRKGKLMSKLFNDYSETLSSWERFVERTCLHFATNVSIKGHSQRAYKSYTIDCIVMGRFLPAEERLKRGEESNFSKLTKYRLVLSQALVEVDHWEIVIQVAEKTITAKVYSPIAANVHETFLIALSKLEEGSYAIKYNTKSRAMVAIQEIYTTLY